LTHETSFAIQDLFVPLDEGEPPSQISFCLFLPITRKTVEGVCRIFKVKTDLQELKKIFLSRVVFFGINFFNPFQPDRLIFIVLEEVSRTYMMLLYLGLQLLYRN
jgi:hypothetical protein